MSGLCGCTQSCDTDSAGECNASKPLLHPLLFSGSLRAPLRPTAFQPRDQLQALMKRQSGNWGSGGGGPARQSSQRVWVMTPARLAAAVSYQPPMEHHMNCFRTQLVGKHRVCANRPRFLPCLWNRDIRVMRTNWRVESSPWPEIVNQYGVSCCWWGGCSTESIIGGVIG